MDWNWKKIHGTICFAIPFGPLRTLRFSILWDRGKEKFVTVIKLGNVRMDLAKQFTTLREAKTYCSDWLRTETNRLMEARGGMA